jgi:hypothetical protein
MIVDEWLQLLIGSLAIACLSLGLVVWQLYQAGQHACAGAG